MFIAQNDLIQPISADQRATDRGYLLGEGLFETILVTNGHLQHFQAHLKRLQRGANALGVKWPSLDLEQLSHSVLNANALQQSHAALRITLTQHSEQRGLTTSTSEPQLLITAYPYERPSSNSEHSAMSTPYIINEHSKLTAYKTTNYLEHIQAKRYAQERGYDEALLFNTQGHLCCSSIGNVFLYLHQQLITPPESDGALPGITREQLFQATHPIITRSITHEDLQQADSVFHTNSLIGIQCFSHIDHRSLTPLPHSLADRLQRSIVESHQ